MAEDLAITIFATPVLATPVLAITVEDGTTFGKKATSATARILRGHVEVVEPSELRVNQHGNVAVVTGALS
jgi:hypothetical protein